MVEVYSLHIQESLDHSLFHTAQTLIGSDKRERMHKFLRLEDSVRLVLTDVLIRSVIVAKTGLRNSQIVFGKSRFGKPYLKGCQDFRFSLSHSGDWVVCSIGREENGVDVEHVQPINLKIAQRFFTKHEYDAILQKPLTDRSRAFYKLWTLKESYVKAIGTGLTTPMDSFVVEESNDSCSIKVLGMKMDYSLKTYDLDSDYCVSVCSKENTISGRIVYKSLRKVINDIKC
ncbi:MAG: 4'-phosphopantetheinyl transferase family protein [Candidatus Saccharibacteria bacterium]